MYNYFPGREGVDKHHFYITNPLTCLKVWVCFQLYPVLVVFPHWYFLNLCWLPQLTLFWPSPLCLYCVIAQSTLWTKHQKTNRKELMMSYSLNTRLPFTLQSGLTSILIFSPGRIYQAADSYSTCDISALHALTALLFTQISLICIQTFAFPSSLHAFLLTFAEFSSVGHFHILSGSLQTLNLPSKMPKAHYSR